MFAFVGIYMPFWPVWLTAHGLSAPEIGAVLSAALWIKVVANPAIARLADRSGERKRPMLLLAVLALVGFALFPFVDGFWPILLLSVFASISYSAIMPLGETVALSASYERRLDYGRVRLWGSLAFIAASILGGRLLGIGGPDIVLWLIIGCLGWLLLSCALLPDTRQARGRGRKGDVLRLARNPVFLAFLAAGSLIQASHAVIYGFGTLHWQAAGIPDDVIGWLWAEGVVAEIALFAISGAVVARVGVARLLLLAALAGLLRWMLTAVSTDLGVLIVGQALHGFTFGAAHLAAMHFITRAAPPEMAATAQTLYSAVAAGIVMGAAAGASGLLYEAFAGGAFFVMALLSGVGGLFALIVMRGWDGGRLTA